MQQPLLDFGPVRKIYSVSELTGRIRALLDDQFGDVWVSGEISGTRLASSGHYYFTLKDGESQLKCACFRMNARYLRFKPQDGVAVIARGRLDVYDARGEYQLLVEHLEPKGYGALQLAFEQLKKKLAAEGLFETARKRPLPKLPTRIGIVTSPAGAVIQDLVNILCRRFPGVHVRLYPALVQGEGSVEQVCRGLRYFSESEWAEVIVVARGGGSLEDLWTFNEEAVARAIAASSVPVISAIGHETDFTIADFVADLRAATPSAAAELVVCTREQLLEGIAGHRRHLEQLMRYRLSIASRILHERGTERVATTLHRRLGRSLQRVDELERCVLDETRKKLRIARERHGQWEARLRRLDLRLRFAEARQRLQHLDNSSRHSMQRILSESRACFGPLDAHMRGLSPLRILERGYAIVQDAEGHVLKNSSDTHVGDAIRIRLGKGKLDAAVVKTIPDDSSALPS